MCVGPMGPVQPSLLETNGSCLQFFSVLYMFCVSVHVLCVSTCSVCMLCVACHHQTNAYSSGTFLSSLSFAVSVVTTSSPDHPPSVSDRTVMSGGRVSPSCPGALGGALPLSTPAAPSLVSGSPHQEPLCPVDPVLPGQGAEC